MTPYYEHAGVTIFNGDCREVLPFVRADLLLTDPPYGIGEKWTKSEWVAKRGVSRLWGHRETWDDATIPLWLLEQAIDRSETSIVWGGNYYALPSMRGWLTWDKVQTCTGSDCELAWTNLNIPVRTFRMSRIDAYQNNAADMKSHPTEKPVALLRWCIGLAGQPTSVLDPFMGSGSTLVAAKAEGRHAIGIEIEERYCEIAAKRLSQEVLPLELGA